MSIFSRFSQVQELRKQNRLLENQIKNYRQTQELLVKDILTLQEVNAKYTGNEYKQYESAIQAISDKYNCQADWGCLFTGIIIDLRAAFTLGEGIKIVHKTDIRAEAERELQWAEDFFAWNDFDAEGSQEMAKEAEIEGKIALKLIYENEPWRSWPGMVSARYISWLSKKYTVEPDPEDYLYYKKLKWGAAATTPNGELDENEFIYKKFGGRLNKPNEAQPKIMRCLTQIDRLDKALRDLREIDHLFASPTPDFKVDDAKQVDGLLKKLEDINWKIGKLLVHTGEFKMVGPDSAGVMNLIQEIELTIKLISGTTGIPIHFLGLLDLLKNRATGDNTRELVMAATAKERIIWKGAYEELITKAMIMFNENVYKQKSSNAKLDPTKIGIDIPLITQEHWDRIEKVLIPASIAGIVSPEYVASQIPGLDSEVENEIKEKANNDELEKAKSELEAMKIQLREGEVA